MTTPSFRRTEAAPPATGGAPPATEAPSATGGVPPATEAPSAGARGLRAVLFDMDGLLVDSEPLWFEAEAVVMDRMGGPWTLADQHHLLGGSLDRSVAYMRGKAPRPAEPAVVARWLIDGMTGLIRQRGVPLMPGAAELLAEVAAAGVPHALVTSAERQIMHAVMEVTGLRFPATVCGEDVTRRKPDPEPYLRAASLLSADPRWCVALDDSPSGIAAAEAAGCAMVAVPSVPVPPRPGRVTVGSLREVDLGRLREIAAAIPVREWQHGPSSAE